VNDLILFSRGRGSRFLRFTNPHLFMPVVKKTSSPIARLHRYLKLHPSRLLLSCHSCTTLLLVHPGAPALGPTIPDHAQRPQQHYVHRPPASDSDEGPIVVPALPPGPGPAVVVQPPAEVQVAPVIVPPPGAFRQESPSRGSPLSSSRSSIGSPRFTLYAVPSDVHRVPFHSGSRRTSPNRSSISSRTLPPGHFTIVNVAAPHPPMIVPTFPTMAPPQTVGSPGPTINIVAPSTPSIRENPSADAEHHHPTARFASTTTASASSSHNYNRPGTPKTQTQALEIPHIIPSSFSSRSSGSTRSRSRSRERRHRPSYTPSRTSRAHSYSPTRRRYHRSPSYSPSRRPSQYYSSSRPTHLQTPTTIPGQGVTVLPVPQSISTTHINDFPIACASAARADLHSPAARDAWCGSAWDRSTSDHSTWGFPAWRFRCSTRQSHARTNTLSSFSAHACSSRLRVHPCNLNSSDTPFRFLLVLLLALTLAALA
jgi:hypothetical protein